MLIVPMTASTPSEMKSLANRSGQAIFVSSWIRDMLVRGSKAIEGGDRPRGFSFAKALLGLPIRSNVGEKWDISVLAKAPMMVENGCPGERRDATHPIDLRNVATAVSTRLYSFSSSY